MALIAGARPTFRRGDVIHEVFASLARDRPHATALVHGDSRITYGDLDLRGNAMAERLWQAGVRPGDLVAVLVPRDPRWVAALLGVLKCGAAYLSMDPRWPAERIAEVVRQAQASVTAAAAELAGQCSGREIAVPAWAELAGISAAPTVAVNGSDVSTVFLTSGSSGRPKLVPSPHRATVRMLPECDFARFDETTVMAQGSPVPWDAASLELWGPLLTGGTSILLEEPHLQPASLRRHIERDGLNTAFITTSLFNVLVEEDAAAFRGLRVVMTGGEKASEHHIRRFLQLHPQIALVHAYGPVESTIFTTTWPIAEADVAGPGIPLGRPVNHTSIAILDGPDPCPPGEIGEICVGGAGLSPGYLHDPQLSAQKFADVTVEGETVRMYRSGDYGYLSAGGVLYFAGRRDRQVKIRGHRIEPGEIEDRMTAIPGITRSVVVPIPNSFGLYAKLAAFYTTDVGGPTTEAVTALLRERLPAYLVPDTVTKVDRIPLAATGKADHAQLLAQMPTATARETEAPQGDMEAMIADELATVLGSAVPGRHDSFRDAGVGSLDLLRLTSRLAERLGRAVPQSALAAYPSIAGLAAQLRGGGPVPATGSDRWSDATGVPLLPMQRGFWLTSVLDPRSAASQCVSAWTDLEVAPSVLQAALDDVYHRHPALRAHVRLADEPLAVVPGEVPPLQVPEADPKQLLELLHAPFDLDRGPVVRAAYAVQESGRLTFGIAVHHAFYDEWSEQNVVGDLQTAIAARVQGQAPVYANDSPTLSQIYDCVQRQTAGLDLAAQRDYWRTRLSGAPRLESLAPPQSVGSGPHLDPVTVAIAAPMLARMRDQAQRQGAAISHLLAAHVAEAIAEVTGVGDVVLGLMVAKRGYPLLARAVTCLLDPVCLRLSPTGHLASTVDDCRTEVAAALAHQEVSVNELTGGRGRPAYDVLFVAQHRPHPSLYGATPVPLFQPTERELIVEARPQPDGGLLVGLLPADRPEYAARAGQVADALSRSLTAPIAG